MIAIPTPPRKIRARKTSATTANKLALSIAGAIAVFWMLLICVPFITLIVGQPVNAIADRKQEIISTKGTSTYRYYFHYQVNGETINDWQPITLREYDTVASPGTKLDARSLNLLGYRTALTGEAKPQVNLRGTLAGIGFLVLVSIAAVAASRHKRKWETLTRNGITTEGFVIGRETLPNGRCELRFEYQPKGSDACENRCAVSKSTQEQYPLGASLTILYDSRKPTEGLPYEFSDFEVG